MPEAALQDKSEGDGTVKTELKSVISHYWVCSYPFFTTTLFLLPSAELQKTETPAISTMSLYDPDGELINDVRLQFPQTQLEIIDVDMLLGSCKIEGGMKHGHLVLRSPEGTGHLCRISSAESSSIMGDLTELTFSHHIFFPILFATNRLSSLTLVNYESVDAKVKCRLYRGNRSPEIEVVVPGSGARVVNIEAEFPGFNELIEDERVQAYLRLGVKDKAVVGAQLIERGVSSNGGIRYSTVC